MKRILALAACLVATPAAFAAGGLEGRWLTQDKEAIVEVGDCQGSTCGKIVWLKTPIDPDTGKPFRDGNNSDEKLQRRPILGLPTLMKIEPAKGGWTAISYDPREGEEHDITIKLTGGGTIVLRGCGLGGLVCLSETWTRAK